MKKIIFLLAVLCNFSIFGKDSTMVKSPLPSAVIKDINGNVVNATTINNGNNLIYLTFWATWCKPCIQELNELNDVYDVWRDEFDVKIVAVSVDDIRTSPKVKPFVNGKNWDFEVYLDQNGDLRRMMNVNNVPHSFLINDKGEIIWQQNSHTVGDEHRIYEIIRNYEMNGVVNE
jgi:thiol-disulfide isomerase/thioredoxin